MPSTTNDPIRKLKSHLRRRTPGSGDPSPLSSLAPELREIESRLARARAVEARIGLGELFEALLGSAPRPTA